MTRNHTSLSRLDWFLAAIAIFSWSAFAGLAGVVAADGANQLDSPTHRQVRTITPKVDGKSVKLHTIATDHDGNLIVALGGKSMRYERTDGGYEIKMVEEPGVVQLLDSQGGVIKQWELDTTPSAVGVAPDGTIYIGGSGRIVQLDADGTIGRSVDSPHIGDIDEFRKTTADAMRKSLARMLGSFESQIETLKERIAAIEEKDEEDRTRLEEAQLKAFQTQLKTFEQLVESRGGDSDDGIASAQIDAAVYRAMLITSLAVSDQDVFACASGAGSGGYSVWRIDRDLDPESATVVKKGLSGCCGQMDIQCCDENLLISENTKFRVGIYDREGKRVADFGGRDRSSRKGFGGCCNPMNSLPMSDGTILTAESSIGHIKRFDADGNLVAYIGKASIGGGCKHCALGYDAESDLYYMMHQDKNSICVLANVESSPLTVAEKQLMKRQSEFLARAAGKWEMDDGKDTKKTLGSAIVSLFGGGRGGSSQHPVTSLDLGADGSAKILEGMYKAYGDKAQIEVVSDQEDENDESASNDSVSVALAIDQVRFVEGTWTFKDDDTVTLAFTSHQPVTLRRQDANDSCESQCGGKDCDNPNCEDASCPKRLVAASRTASVAVEDEQAMEAYSEPESADYIIVDSPASTTDPPPLVSAVTLRGSMAIPKPKFEYKLLSRKQLGKEPEAKLNEMGAEGWEFCGRVGRDMMFKRIDKYEMTAVSQ